MSSAEIRRIVFEHIVDSPQYRFVCVNVDGRTRNFFMSHRQHNFLFLSVVTRCASITFLQPTLSQKLT